MARIKSHKNESEVSKNPTSKYLEWKSNDKLFSYYDSDAEHSINVDLPLRFLLLTQYHTIGGFHSESNSRIYSNYVLYIGSEDMNVRSYKGGEIAKGLYKNIKTKIMSAGGKYHKSLFVMLEDGSIANISLKGSAVREWTDFFDQNEHLLDNQWIEVKSATDHKKGSIKYSTPDFSVGKNLTKAQDNLADQASALFQAFADDYFSKNENEVDVNDIEVDIDF
jgi:hypothetical protein